MSQKEFRKPPRYMVGDIVYSHGFICIVCSIYPFNIDYSYDLKVIDGQSLGKICQNDIRHVHIWEEILKKNGWEKPDGFDSYWLNKIGLLQEGDTWHSALGSTKIAITLGDILYVHQLQHLLFCLGLNSEMEV